MMATRTTFLPIAALLLLAPTGCAHFSPGAGNTSFEQATLNATYYGAYHRPLSDGAGTPRSNNDIGDTQLASNTTDRADREDRDRGENRGEDRGEDRERNRDRDEPTPNRTQPSTNDVVATSQSAPTPPNQRSQPVGPAPALEEATATNGSYNPSHAAAYIQDVYALNETGVAESAAPASIVDIYRYAQENGTIYHTTRPAIGDLVFFHNTFDRNGDGRNNDWYTHIGLVESVNDGGTVGVMSYVDGRIARILMNLDDPTTTEADGDSINTIMRAESSDDPQFTQHLAGELFAGFGSLLGNRSEVVVLDTWAPDASQTLTASN